MITEDVMGELVGAPAVDRDEHRIGEVRHVSVDAATERPAWASVQVPPVGSEVLLPIAEADWDEQVLHLPIVGAAIVDAPPVGAEPLTEQEQERLLTHYGVPTVRSPRSSLGLLQVTGDEVSYSVHDDLCCDDDAPGA